MCRRPVLVAALACLAGCGSSQPSGPPSAGSQGADDRPAVERLVPTEGLSVGVTEPNPAFFRTEPVAPQAETWRLALDDWNPAVLRLVVDWTAFQPDAGAEPDFDQPRDGCMREIQPCIGWAGLRDQLATVAARQREHPTAWSLLVVFTGTPAWAARPAVGCERPDTEPRSRFPTRAGVEAYGRFVRDVLELAAEVGAEARYWSPWNEPNQGFGFAGQRASCDPSARSLAIAPYAQLAREMAQVLQAAPGEQELVLGELAGLLRPTPRNTTVAEMVAGLPREVVCSSRIWSQHGYIGGRDPVDELTAALDARGCELRHRIWLTEAGAGGARRGRAREGSEIRRCEAMRARLERWYDDERVDLAVQYTIREDDRFPTGLVTTDLARAYPVLDLWIAWGGGRRAADPPPPFTCGD